ncbi:IclR family transcriptional regulator [Bosea caraganae]|uniref:IclR family transcriptional regulator n=1 Tax=Bosea caraganae TaxID=2763117 RepID=A0A370L1D2_9HYPH|nr:IclR family transcriptional regulator [Bosea caraganae]RDJ21305.1 IclR family transcriptional regulator [Bosea caraganae]RDJ26445.1 IclR family transcriptional regulator [Bosea caraganae]
MADTDFGVSLDTNVSATALKALGVLDFVGEQRRPVTVAEVASAIGADRATAYRMLMTLVQSGYVQKEADAKHYRLTFKVLSLARQLVGEDERARHILACLRRISDETGETVHYSMLERDAAVLVFRAKGSQRVAVDFQIGDRSPLHCTSIGKVLLAYHDKRLTEAVIASGLAKVAPNTVTDPDELRRSLVRIRAEGYAFDDLEFAPDMRCIALPVFESGGEVPGGIAISGPASRFDLAKLEALRDVAMIHATALSRELGGLF